MPIKLNLKNCNTDNKFSISKVYTLLSVERKITAVNILKE